MFALPANIIKCADRNQVGNDMGQGFTIKCEKCGTENSYLQGIGFMYYSFLERTKEDVIKGKFGKDAKAFFILPSRSVPCTQGSRSRLRLGRLVACGPLDHTRPIFRSNFLCFHILRMINWRVQSVLRKTCKWKAGDKINGRRIFG